MSFVRPIMPSLTARLENNGGETKTSPCWQRESNRRGLALAVLRTFRLRLVTTAFGVVVSVKALKSVYTAD